MYIQAMPYRDVCYTQDKQNMFIFRKQENAYTNDYWVAL